MHGLGDLEAAVMNILWRDQPLKVRDVLDRLETGKKLAYTTVMTVLDNLHRKGWVTRELVGKAYQYEPALSRAEAAAQTVRDVLASSGDPEGVLMHFTLSATEHESDLLRQALLKRKRSSSS
ncbi:BlaI/MecI/CopY family transcriptional regulator [Lentzea sp. HUAS TT2]|uniref:BlaI/MecI/CopY family transcriptional regulator n=1 Tax=Lentzea sp. HUAS TT2 TaxID=3447454 RepID=UPI003F6EC1F4